MKYIIGIDIGTSSLEAILINEKASLIDKVSSPYNLYTPQSGYAEQNPEDWYDAFEIVLNTLKEKNEDYFKSVVGIGIAGQMHSLIVLDKNDEVIRPSILWNDVRTTKQTNFINKSFNIIDITHNKAVEGFTLPKLLWIKENEPENFKKIKSFLLPKDYLIFKLTNKKTMDFSDGSGTMMLDFTKKKWSNDIFEAFGLDKNYAPNLIENNSPISEMDKNLSEKFGFENPVMVYSGGADNAAALIANNVIDEEVGLLSIGTSGVIITNKQNKLKPTGILHNFYHVYSKKNYYMGVTLSAGNSLNWFRNTFYQGESFEDLLKNLEDIPSGSEGLIFAPYLMGERVPYYDSNIRGSFIGVDIIHTKDHFIRAVMEGVVYSLRDSLEIMEQNNQAPSSLVSVGGGSKNKEWLKIQANILNKEIIVLKDEKGPSFGASLVALSGILNKDITEISRDSIEIAKIIKPNQKDVDTYNAYYDVYTSIYKQTKIINEKLSEIKKYGKI